MQRGSALEGGERRAGRDDEHVRIGEELLPLVRPGADWQRPERDVELAPLDHLEELFLVHRFAEHDFDARMRLAEPTQQGGEDAGTHALEGADAEPTRIAGFERQHVRFRREQSRLDDVGVTEEDLPGLGEGDRPGAAWAFDEPQADDALERRDLLRDRRLRVAERLRGLPERAFVRDRLQRDEVAEVEPEPAISFHDRRLAAHQCKLMAPFGDARSTPQRYAATR